MRLNIGAGGQIAEGWINLDRAPPPSGTPMNGEFVLHDLTTEMLPYAADSVDGVVMHHVIDLLERDDARNVLEDVYHVLKPGGYLRLSFASLTKGITAALRADYGWFPEPKYRDNIRRKIDLDLTIGFFITQGGARRWYVTPFNLVALLQQVGFKAYPTGIGRTDGPRWLTELDSREQESEFVEAYK